MKSKFSLVIIASLCLTTLMTFFGCKNPTEKNTQKLELASQNDPLKITATIGMVGDVLRNIVGDHGNVDILIGQGIDPHLYKASRGDVVSLMEADIIFYNGTLLEGQMGDTLVKVSTSGKPVYAVTDNLQNQENYLLTDEENHYDPHVWMDVQGWMSATEVMVDALSKLDPKNASTYTSNAEKYKSELSKLDTYAKESIATIPETQRFLVTAHDAFGYMGRAYGLDVRGIQGLSTESEAGVRDIEELIDFLVQQKIPSVFIETSIAAKNIKALIEGAKAKNLEVSIGGELFSDAMGAAGSYEGTYIGMIDHNITTITRALGGQAPEKGMNGLLSLSH